MAPQASEMVQQVAELEAKVLNLQVEVGAKAHLEAVLRGEIAKLRSNEKETNDAHESEICVLRICTGHQAQSLTVLQSANEKLKSQNKAANAVNQLLQTKYDELCKERECKPIAPGVSSRGRPLLSKLLQPKDFIPRIISGIPPPLCTEPSETSTLKPLGEAPVDVDERLLSAKRKRPAAQMVDSSTSKPVLKRQKLQQHPLRVPEIVAPRSSRYSYDKDALSVEQNFHVQEHGDLMDIPRGQCRGAASGHGRPKGMKLKGEDSQDQSDEGTGFHHDGTEEQKPFVRTRTPAPYAIDYSSPVIQQEHYREVTAAPELDARKIPSPYSDYIGSLTPDQIRTVQGTGDSLGVLKGQLPHSSEAARRHGRRSDRIAAENAKRSANGKSWGSFKKASVEDAAEDVGGTNEEGM